MISEKHTVVCVLGGSSASRANVCSFYAKKAHSEGLEMYHRRGVAQTLLNPATYPERLNHMLAAVSLSDACVLDIREGFGWAEGESIIALTHAAVEQGVIVTGRGGQYSDALSKMVRDTAAQRFRIVEVEGGNYSKIDLDSFSRKPVKCVGNIISVDNVFSVKGVGTVALGFVMCGRVAVHDTFKIPGGKELRVQSIQVMDEDVEEAEAGSRVGLALKGATEKELGDQFFLADTQLVDQVEAKITVDRLYKQKIEVDKAYHLAVLGQVVAATPTKLEGETITLKLAKPIPHIAEPTLLANMNLPVKTLRVVGHIQM
ncbi:MAG: hypothetical protein QW453_03155 [Thermoprotei archaeon]